MLHRLRDMRALFRARLYLALPGPMLAVVGSLLGACSSGAASGAASAMPPPVVTSHTPQPPPPLPGLRATSHAEPVFGGQYALVEVGPLRAQPVLADHEPVPPLLLVHGLAQQGMGDFYPLLEALALDRRVLLVDLPGFGASTRGNRPYRPQAYAEFLARVIDAHAGGRSDVAGHSMGAAVSLALAGQYPHRVRRLALLDAAGVLFRETLIYEMQNEFADEPEANLLTLVGRDLWRAAIAVASPFALEPDAVLSSELLREKVLSADPMRIAALALLEHNFDAELRDTKAPTLLIWGRQDTTAPLRTYHVLRERLPVWESTVLPGVGHNPMSEAPLKVSERLTAFFDTSELGTFESKRPGVELQRQGGCNGQPVRTFQGRWDRLEIRGCRQVLIQDAVIESLLIENSSVELRHVTVEQGTEVDQGILRATGSLFTGETALRLHASNVDLAGVEVAGTGRSLEVVGESSLIASVSGASTDIGRKPLHGRLKLARGTVW